MTRLAVIWRHINGLLQDERFANQLRMMIKIKRKSSGKSGVIRYPQMGIEQHENLMIKFLSSRHFWMIFLDVSDGYREQNDSGQKSLKKKGIL
jgi:hypothetical protein